MEAVTALMRALDNLCTCSYGTPAARVACSSHQAPTCSSCTAGYHLHGTSCEGASLRLCQDLHTPPIAIVWVSDLVHHVAVCSERMLVLERHGGDRKTMLNPWSARMRVLHVWLSLHRQHVHGKFMHLPRRHSRHWTFVPEPRHNAPLRVLQPWLSFHGRRKMHGKFVQLHWWESGARGVLHDARSTHLRPLPRFASSRRSILQSKETRRLHRSLLSTRQLPRGHPVERLDIGQSHRRRTGALI
jgi:hypothetical protein